MAPQIGYMHLEAVQYYYGQLKPNLEEANVDMMWNNILPLYFTVEGGIRNGLLKKKVVLVEVIGDTGSDRVWKDAVEEATNYTTVVRDSQSAYDNTTEMMYAIVTVGCHSRFYELAPGERLLEDYGNTGGRPYEFKEDEGDIDRLLMELVNKASH
ncbi:hypothetical protein QBC33DRAFT_584283 [Phialemonium atrogriseum]|uniref:Uncharacterized protein n=1 Tax=Phialemonium atrogriseum TaxID=1093897 RepID=A0AAJ0FU79_9PEZI|nr:uncharacterized protein QBC33DRAFT_584283 [Phialemonium atrogriseum]KAK1772860.1 hypothetical protein QBC33DRAFT_584283 [Phialemonium atrogriseum]